MTSAALKLHDITCNGGQGPCTTCEEELAAFEAAESECEVDHASLKTNPIAWRLYTTPVGRQQKLDGSYAHLANCNRCHSTIAREAA